MTLSTFLSSTLVLGLLEAAPLVLAAMGFTLIFRLNGFLNVAYAENITLGAYFAVIFNSILGWNFYVSIIPAALLSGLLSVATYLIVFRPAFRRGVGKTELIILSVGVSYFIRYAARILFGNDLFNFNFSSTSYLSVFGIGVTNIQLTCIGLVAVISVGIYFFIYKTNYGEKMRALADNEELAMISGINPTKVSLLIWFIAGSSAGLAGLFYGTFSFVSSSLGWNLILIVIMVTIVGGIGSIRGALVASAFVGIVTSAVNLKTSNSLYGEIVLLIIFIGILKIRKVRV
jgi:branched-subunit amino acid ABC-type transport system permease component